MEKLKPEVRIHPPGPKAQKIIEKDQKHSSPSYIKEYPLVVDRGEGPWIYDVDGNRYLDFMAGIAVASTGHSHPQVVNAIKEAADKFLHICGTDFYYQSFSDMCAKLTSYLPDMGPKRVFLSNSGTEAVEGAIKLARHHTKRSQIIAFKGAFHGRTTGALALNASKVTQRAFFGPFISGITHLPYPNPYRSPMGASCGKCHTDCECALKIETELFQTLVNPKEVAAIFVEPILGEGGYITPPKKFLRDLRRICDQNGILLVFDEVQSGIGRTGRMFAAECFDVMPDIITSAKGIASGMPLGAIIAKKSVMTWDRGSHGSTYGGNPLCCAAGLATLDVVEKLLPQVRSTGEYLTSKLQNMKLKYPQIGDVRGPGLMIGVEFSHPETKAPLSDYVSKLEQLAFRQGLLLLSCGKSTIRLAPPLVITNHEADVALGVLEECLKELGIPN